MILFIYNKLFSFCFLGIFLTLFIHINISNAQNIGIGFKAGINASTQLNNFEFTTGDLDLDLKPKFISGYNFSLIYRNRLAKNLRIQAEPTYFKTGASFNESFTYRGFEFQTDSEVELSYIQIPFLMELTTTPPDLEEFPKPWEETTYHLSLGVYGGYLLDATFSGINSGSPIGVDFEEEFSNDVTSEFSEYDSGFIIGGGFEHGYQNKIGMVTRMILGLLRSKEEDGIQIEPNNLSISVAIYYMF